MKKVNVWWKMAIVVVLATGSAWARDVGINLSWIADWSPQLTYADVVKNGRYWTAPMGWPTACVVDANGWPTGDAEMIMMATGLLGVQGTYKLSFEASTPNVNIGFNMDNPSGCITVANKVYSNGVITADVIVSPSAVGGSGFLNIMFTNTVNGVRNVKCMRPGQQPGDLFANALLNRLSIFSTIRTMQTQNTISCTGIITWSQRAHVSQVNYGEQIGEEDSGHPNYLGQLNNGMPLEHIAMLANQTNKDIWVCVPWSVDDDYITKMAQLFKYGSDGVNPYTSTQSNPLYPPLHSNLKLYVEFFNEVWNYHINEARDIAVDLVNNQSDPYHFNYDSVNNEWYWAWRWQAWKTMHISNLFRSVFGDSEMPHTGSAHIRPVFAGQLARYCTFDHALLYLQNVYGTNNSYGNPQHQVNYYLYAVAGAPYPDLPNSAADNLTLDGGANDIFNLIQNNDWWTAAITYRLGRLIFTVSRCLHTKVASLCLVLVITALQQKLRLRMTRA
jgi:hypothetical protein